MRRFALAVLLLAGTGRSAEPPPADFDRFSLEQGLSQSIVESIAQDPKGFLWFATEDGLNRFDGYRFTVFRNVPGEDASLAHNELKALAASPDGALWIGFFQGGLNLFDPATEHATRWAHAPDPSSLAAASVRALLASRDGGVYAGTQGGGVDRVDRTTLGLAHAVPAAALPNADVRALAETPDGALWIGTNGGGLVRRGPGSRRLELFRHHPGDPGSLAHDAVTALLVDRAGTLWVGTYGGGLDAFDPKRRAFVHHRHDPARPGSLASDLVRALCEDHGGALWVGTDGAGLDRRDAASGEFAHYRNRPLDPRSLSSDRVWSLHEDRSRVLWVGTYGGGISKLDLARKRFRHFRNEPGNVHSLGQNIVWSLFAQGDVLWIGTDTGGLDRFDRAAGRFTHYRHDPRDPASLAHDTVRVVFVDRGGTLWVATNGGGLDRLDASTGRFVHHRHDAADPGSLAHDELRSVMQARDGALWIGTFGGGLDRLDPATLRFAHFRHDPNDPSSLSDDFVRLAVEDRDGALWVGTQGGGLNRLDPRTGHFARYRNDPSDPASLSNDYVFSIHLARDGTLWLGTFGGGLNRFDRATGRFTRFGVRDGFSSDSIYSVLEDDDGRLWISTTNGLNRFDPKTRQVLSYDVRDGLQSHEFNGGAAHRAPSGELLFGGINGFNAFFPREITSNPEPPQVALTAVHLLGRPLRPGEKRGNRTLMFHAAAYAEALRLAHDEAPFSLEFAALHFSAPQKNRYAYRMEGFRSDWIPVDASQRTATFTGLAPGRYVFRVKAANGDGVWNEEGASLTIRIDPPFWAAWWFRGAALALALGGAAVWMRAHLATVRMRTQLAAAHEAQMSIMPHAAPRLAGWDVWGACLPASEVGGDFYDWIPLPGGRLGVAVGDVAGKGMQAAMAAVMSDGMLAAFAERDRAPEEILTELNDAMRPKMRRRMFAAVCFAVLEPGGALRFANAGLCEPLLRSASGTSALGVGDACSFPLGAREGTRYASRTVLLAPGDVVLLTTDGVPEAMLPHRVQLGYDAVRELLAGLDLADLDARGVVEAVVAGVRRAAHGVPQSDDMALVAIRFTGETRASSGA